MRTIHKKIWTRDFDLVAQGKKKFEVRLDNFAIDEGDTSVLEEWDERAAKYTGRKFETMVTLVRRTKDMPFWTEEEKQKHWFQIIQIEPKYRGRSDPEAMKPGIYEHYKGESYQVIGVARHSENGQRLVVYKRTDNAGGWWVRPLDMFTEEVEVNGKKVPRFRFIGQ
jgi:hypothetical protein